MIHLHSTIPIDNDSDIWRKKLGGEDEGQLDRKIVAEIDKQAKQDQN